MKAKLDSGLILLLGNSESPMNYADNCYRFRQDSSFLYFFGLDQPDLAAVIDLDEGREIIFGDELTIDDIVWMGHLPTVADTGRTGGRDRHAPGRASRGFPADRRRRRADRSTSCRPIVRKTS